MNRTNVAACLVAFSLMAIARVPSAEAVVFNAGETFGLPGTTSMAEPHLEGIVLEDETIPFSFVGGPTGGLIMGTIQHRVVRSSVDNTLDFYWRVTNDEKSAGAIAFFRIGDFAAPEFNANWRSDGLGDVAATSGHRFDPPQEQYFNYRFDDDSLAPGQESYFMLMDTTATEYARTAIMDVATAGTLHASDVVSTFSPVPEPMSALLLSLAAAIAGRRRGRSRA